MSDTKTAPAQSRAIAKTVDLSAKALARPAASTNDLKALFDSPAIRNRLMEVVPKHVTPERLIKVALSSIMKTPKLLECTQQSLIQSIIQLGELGLEPGGGLGLAYLVPYNNKIKVKDAAGKERDQWVMMAQAIIGYRGYIHLARQSGELQAVRSRVVHAKDKFKVRFGLVEELEHVPSEESDPGPPRLVYCVADFKDGGHHLEVMTWQEVMKIKAGSKGKNAAPWQEHEEEMAKKTVVRRAQKYWPLASELVAKANEVDNGDVIDGSFTRAAGDAMFTGAPPLQVVPEGQQLEEGAPEDSENIDPTTGEDKSFVPDGQPISDSTEPPEHPIDAFHWSLARADKEAVQVLTKRGAELSKEFPNEKETITNAITARRKELGL